jgi:hypothetical protein
MPQINKTNMNITQIKSCGEKKTQRMVKLAALLDSMKNETNEQPVLNLRHSLQVCGDTERNIYAKKASATTICRCI